MSSKLTFMWYSLFITLYGVVRKLELKTLVQRSSILNLWIAPLGMAHRYLQYLRNLIRNNINILLNKVAPAIKGNYVEGQTTV